jgi:hypothetical protein
LRKEEALTRTTDADNAAIAPPDVLDMHAEKFVLKMSTLTDPDSAAKAPPKSVAEQAWKTILFQKQIFMLS